MGFGPRRNSAKESANSSQLVTNRQRGSTASQQSPSYATGTIWTNDIEQGEQHFGMEIQDTETLQRLQIVEETYGDQIYDWIEAEMPAEILGKTRDMKAFRQRQAERPPAVPKNIERQNNY